MSRAEDVQQSVLKLLREELENPLLSLEQVLQHPAAKRLVDSLLRAFDESTSSSGVSDADPPSLARFHDSPALIKAALQDHFDLRDLKVNEQERAALLPAADIVTVDGERRLRLQDQSRANILNDVKDSKLYRSILESSIRGSEEHQAGGRDQGWRSSVWLQRFLKGDAVDLDNLPPTELKAAFEGRSRLRLVEGLSRQVPAVGELARRVEMAELLEPLRVLVGAQGGWKGAPRRDRFVGRESELRQLRSFVDELTSHGAFEAFGRFVKRTTRAVLGGTPPGLMTIEARGGLGKSTLLAKFVLDHALDQARPFPFAYLDFDRAGLDAERPLQLLLEVARQVRLQFPAAGKFDRLIEDIRARCIEPPSDSPSSGVEIMDPFSRFVEILRDHATHRERAFLLVFDTLELVQWNTTTMGKLAEFVAELRRKGLDELKVVASGRAAAPELGRALGPEVPSIPLRLKALSSADATTMATNLGESAVGTDWKRDWSAAIVGSGYEDEPRREPLAVRVAVDLLARAQGSRDALAEQIRQTGPEAHGDFVAWIYQKRIIDHVRDPLARKLAWPGLVVRRVTEEIARDLLAGLCGIVPKDAAKAFTALGQEIWMVTREGDALRHRPDLRARTLPLMKRHDKDKFEQVAQAAVAYFGVHRQRSREDYAEWIYHRLLRGEPPAEVARDVDVDVLALLARAEDDFPPDSAAASYLASRTAKKRLAAWRIRSLQPNDALYHLSRTSAGAFALDDVALDKPVLEVADRVGRANLGSDEETAWARALWIKTGAWRHLVPSIAFTAAMTKPQWRAHLFWAARVAPTLPLELRQQLHANCLHATSLLSAPDDRLGLRTVVQRMALARSVGASEFADLDNNVKGMLALAKPSAAPSLQAALRTAIVFGQACRKPALSLWLMSRRRGSAERVLEPTISLAELEALSRIVPEAAELLERLDRSKPGAPWRIADEATLTSVHRMLDELCAEPGTDDENQRRQDALSGIFAQRNEDWIVPLGYAAARASGGRVSRAMTRRLAGYEPAFRSGEKTSRSSQPPRDVLAAMYIADEAGDLNGFAELFLAESNVPPAAAAELQFLLQCLEHWSQMIQGMVSLTTSSRTIGGADLERPRPPEPGPILAPNDPQKGRWGGQPHHAGRAVRAVLESVERGVFYFSVVVESTDGSVLQPPIIFHMHHTYPRSVVTVRRIIDNKQARLSDWQAYGVFTIGVQVKDALGEWISLEFDLSQLPNLPKRFLNA
jgi:hypothetical protein